LELRRSWETRPEVYFVGKLFEAIIQNNQINHFKYGDTLRRMCQVSPHSRLQSFADVEKEVGNKQFFEIDFTEAELDAYRTSQTRSAATLQK